MMRRQNSNIPLAGIISKLGFIKSTDLKEFGDPSKSNAFTINRIHNKIPLLESKGRLYVPFIIRSHFPADFFSSQFAQYLRKYVQVLFKKHYPEHAVPYEQEHAEVNRSTHQTMDNGNTFSIYSSANLAPKTLFSSSNNMAVNDKTSHTGSKMGIPIVMPHKESSANQTEMVMGIPIHIHQLQNGSVNQDIPTFTVSNSAPVLQSGNISMFGSFGFRSDKQQNKQGKGQTPADDNRNIIWINPSRITQIRKELKSNNNQNEVTNGGFQLIGNQQGTIEIGNEISSDKNTNNVKLSSLLGISTKSTGVHDQLIVQRTKSKGKDNFVIWQVPVFDNKQIMSSSGSSNGKHTKYEIKNAVKIKVERMKMPTIRNIVLPIDASSNDLKNRPGYKTINTVKQKGKRFKVKAKTHSMLPVDTSLSDLPMKKSKIKGKYRDVWKDLIVNSQKNTGQIPPVTQPRVHQKKRNFSKIPFHDRKMTENIMIKNTNLFPLNGKQKFVKPLSKSVIPEKSFLFKSIKKSIPSNDRQTITQEHNDINSISTKQKHEKRLEDMHNMDHTENSSPTTYERNTIHSSNIITKTNSPVRQSHNEDKLPSITVNSRSMTEPSYHTDQKENEQTSTHDSRRVAIYPYMDEQRVKQLKDEGMILHHNTEDNNEKIFDIDNGNNIQHPSNEILSQSEERNKKENKIPQSAATNERNLQFIKKKIQSNRDQIRTEQINIRKNTILKADKIDDKDVSQNKIKTVGQQNRFHVKMNAIKMPHSEKDRNDIRNLTSLHNINDGYKTIEQSNRNKIQTDQINIRKKILLNAAHIKDKEMSQNKSKHEEQQKRINSRVNAIKMHHRETRIKMINNDRNAIKDQTSFQNSNDGNRNKKQSVGNQIRKERIDIPKKINLYTDKIKDKDVSQNERKTVGQQNIFQNKMNAFIMPHSDTSITINKKDRSIVRDLPSLQNPNDGDENKMKSNTNQRRTLHINIQKKIHLKTEKIKDKHVSQNAGKTLEQRNKFHSKMNAMPHSETIIINNKNDPSVIRDLTTFKHSNSGYKNKVQSNKDHIRIEHINTRKKIHLNAEKIKDKDMSQIKRKTIGLQNKFHSKINAIKIPHSETIITINKKDRNSVSDLTSLQDSNNGYKNKVQSNTNQIRTEYINTPKKIILNADKIRDKPVSQNEINTLKQRNKLHSKWNAIKMPRSETSTKINENDLSAVRNLASLQSPVSGDKNKVQSIRDINRTEQINIRKKILLNADQFRAEQTDIRKKILLNADKIVDIDVSQNDSKHVGQQKNLKSQGTAIKMPHSETSIRMNKQDRNAIRNATSLQNLYDFDKSTHNKLHFKDKLNDSVRSRTKPVMGSLNSIQLADQFVHKREKTVLKSKPGSYSGSSSIQKIQYNKDHLKEEYQEKANSNSSNKYVKKKRQFMKRTFKNQQGSELSLDNVINKNDQPTYKNQVLSDVGSHASNNENILKKPIEQTHANAENNNRPLSIDYYSVDYVSRQPMKEVLKDSNYKRNPSKNSQTKQTLEFQEIVQGLQKKEVYKGALDIQADDDNSDYYYDDEDDYDTTDVPGLKFTTKESYKNLKTPLKSIKNGEADINENEEYYEYDSYSDSFEDEDVLPEAKRKGIEQSRHTNELKFANPISNSNSKHSQKPPLNSQIDGDFSDYSESDYYSDSYYDDSDDSDVVTANNKDQSNDRNVNPQLSKTVSNVDSDLYYDDSSLPEDNNKYEYYDGSDSDMYYDESESDLSDKRQILTTDLQKPKTNTVPESDISKTIPPNLAKAYERIRKLCLCNYVNGRSPNGVLMQRNT
ncbi:Hypothetical predicted protein [Mytilus galloprovincialis]|uniref:Uncharacterized protein n=1 Tax=Mytilus galloprovincialis TaxID=29158 RepID=A0A8B6GAC9_MYTGA|nr:Hypothetical predicted protein [Mytilus galloprovincialis]